MCKVFPQAQFFSRDKYWRGGPPVLVRGKGEGPRPLTRTRAVAAFMTLVTPLVWPRLRPADDGPCERRERGRHDLMICHRGYSRRNRAKYAKCESRARLTMSVAGWRMV